MQVNLNLQDQIDAILDVAPHDPIRIDQIELALVTALTEIIELKKLLNEHTHEVVVGRRGITTADIEGDENDG